MIEFFLIFPQKRIFSGLWITKRKLKIINKNVTKKKIKIGKLEGATSEISKQNALLHKLLNSWLKQGRNISLSFVAAIMRWGTPSMLSPSQKEYHVSNLIHFYVSKILSPKCNMNNILKHSASISQGESWMAKVASQLSLLQGTDSPAPLQPDTCKDPEGTLHIEKSFSFLTQHKATCPTHQHVFSEKSRGRD